MAECVLCGETVTNPVCPECLASEMRSWLNEVQPELLEGFERKNKELSGVFMAEQDCILCKKAMDICPYCYTEHIFKWLLKTSARKAVMEEFMLYFDFDSGRKGYYEHAARIGVVE